MYGTDQKSQFIEFRAKGWSLARISEHLKISVRTLAAWNQSSKTEIQMMRRVEMEALHEKSYSPTNRNLNDWPTIST